MKIEVNRNLLAVFGPARQHSFPRLLIMWNPHLEQMTFTYATKGPDGEWYQAENPVNAAYLDDYIVLAARAQDWLDRNYKETERGYTLEKKDNGETSG